MKTLEAEWQSFESHVLPCLTGGEHRDEVRQAFFAGMLSLITLIVGPGGLPPATLAKHRSILDYLEEIQAIARKDLLRPCKIHGDGGCPNGLPFSMN